MPSSHSDTCPSVRPSSGSGGAMGDTINRHPEAGAKSRGSHSIVILLIVVLVLFLLVVFGGGLVGTATSSPSLPPRTTLPGDDGNREDAPPPPSSPLADRRREMPPLAQHQPLSQSSVNLGDAGSAKITLSQEGLPPLLSPSVVHATAVEGQAIPLVPMVAEREEAVAASEAPLAVGGGNRPPPYFTAVARRVVNRDHPCHLNAVRPHPPQSIPGHLPRCMLPALMVPRPSAAVAWVREHVRRESAKGGFTKAGVGAGSDEGQGSRLLSPITVDTVAPRVGTGETEREKGDRASVFARKRREAADRRRSLYLSQKLSRGAPGDGVGGSDGPAPRGGSLKGRGAPVALDDDEPNINSDNNGVAAAEVVSEKGRSSGGAKTEGDRRAEKRRQRQRNRALGRSSDGSVGSDGGSAAIPDTLGAPRGNEQHGSSFGTRKGADDPMESLAVLGGDGVGRGSSSGGARRATRADTSAAGGGVAPLEPDTPRSAFVAHMAALLDADDEYEASQSLTEQWALRHEFAEGMAPSEYKLFPMSLTFFRPPLRRGAGAARGGGAAPPPSSSSDYDYGSLKPSDMFVHYDAEEWARYCEAASSSVVVLAGEGELDGASAAAASPSLGPFIDNVLIPDRVVFALFHDKGGWERETFAKHYVMPVFEMEGMRAGFTTTDAEGPNAGSSVSGSSSSGDRSRGRAPIVVFTVHLTVDTRMRLPDATVADIAITLGCLREHLLLWYNSSVVDNVFFNFGSVTPQTDEVGGGGGEGGGGGGGPSTTSTTTTASSTTSAAWVMSDVLLQFSKLGGFVDAYDAVRYGERAALDRNGAIAVVVPSLFGGEGGPHHGNGDNGQPTEAEKCKGGLSDYRHDLRISRRQFPEDNGDLGLGLGGGWLSEGSCVVDAQMMGGLAESPSSSSSSSSSSDRYALPSLRTIVGTSDEGGKEGPMAQYVARWAGARRRQRGQREEDGAPSAEEQQVVARRPRPPLSPSLLPRRERLYLRQYSPRRIPAHVWPMDAVGRQYVQHIILGHRLLRRGPLGYDRALRGGHGALATRQDEYLWSFLGQIKSDRHEMIMYFKRMSRRLEDYSSSSTTTQLLPYGYKCCAGDGIEATYGNSLFVPIGRGWLTLDCFRIYEASANGAIPVVVGPWGEVVDTFGSFAGDDDASTHVPQQQQPGEGGVSNSLLDSITAEFIVKIGYEEDSERGRRDARRDRSDGGGDEGRDAASDATAMRYRQLNGTVATDSDGAVRVTPPTLPPFIFAESWSQAADVVEAMVRHPHAKALVARRRDLVVRWFVAKYRYIQRGLVYGGEGVL